MSKWFREPAVVGPVLGATVAGVFGLIYLYFPSVDPGKPQVAPSGKTDPLGFPGPKEADEPLRPSGPKLSRHERANLLAELRSNNDIIWRLKEGLATQAQQLALQERGISEQEVRIAKGQGTPSDIAAAKAAIVDAREAMKVAREIDSRAHEAIGTAKQRNVEIERALAEE